MAPALSTIDIDRPPEDVFGYATDPAKFPRWQRDVLRVILPDDWVPAVGARFTTVRRVGGSVRDMVQEITEFAPPYRWAARGVGGAIRPAAGIEIEPLADGTAARVRFALDFAASGPGGLLVPVLRALAGRAAPVSYQRLKRLLEEAR